MFTHLSNAMFNRRINEGFNIHPMHETMKRLYIAARELKKIEGKSTLARYLDESPQTLNNWEARGLSKSGMIKANALIGCQIGWLKSGTGLMTQLPMGGFAVSTDKLTAVPVVGKSMGGLPERIFTDEGRLTDGFDEYAEVFSGDPNAFVVRVEGNSMYPKFTQGDYALVEPNTDPEIEDDVIVRLVSGEVMLKRLMSRRGGIKLASYNDPQTYDYKHESIAWMYYVAYPIPARKIKSRV